jgi:hypothetical protein
MRRKRAKSMDQTSSRTSDAVGVPEKPRGPLIASSEPSRMLVVHDFQGFIRGMSDKIISITIRALKDEPITEVAPAYLADVICVRERFETRREVGGLLLTEADLPAGVRALCERVHNRIMRECA